MWREWRGIRERRGEQETIPKREKQKKTKRMQEKIKPCMYKSWKLKELMKEPKEREMNIKTERESYLRLVLERDHSEQEWRNEECWLHHRQLGPSLFSDVPHLSPHRNSWLD